jgi:hypothetical protein
MAAAKYRGVFVLVLVGALVAIFFIFHWHSSAASTEEGKPAAPNQPVIVELFTSEGCSSCPPADSLLKKLSEEQPLDGIEIIALEEHVDYWNTLGWTDPFSSVDYSRRQETYAVALPDGGVYTPQMVVDGRSQFIGNRTHETRDQIRWAAAHPKAQLLVAALPKTNAGARSFEVRIDPAATVATSSPLELWVAVTEKDLSSKVTAGENSGELLYHAPVVRLLRKQGPVAIPARGLITFAVDINEKWNAANLSVVAFLSESDSHQIVAAGSSSL